jgi:ABC-2 type transport system permease protein
MARTQRSQALLRFGMFCGIVLFANIMANTFYAHADLTEEKRFTLTQPTRQMLRGLKDRIYVRILLEGEFPAGFKRLQTATREMLDDFRSESGYIDYQFEDPNQGTVEQINERRKALADEGIGPVNLRVAEQGKSSQRLIYPVAIIHFGGRKEIVKLLENQSPSLDPEQVINNSVSLLEYKFANGIKKILASTRPVILFTQGHGELVELQTIDLENNLRQYYDTGRIVLDSSVQVRPDKCTLMIIAKPRTAFSEKDKFKVDQYIMHGGRVMWLIDRMNADLDSLRSLGSHYVPTDYPLNIEDMLFKYGVRIQPDLVLDLESSRIPIVSGQVGNQPQLELYKWPYHPVVLPKGQHPIVKNLDRVELRFCSSIDTIRTKTPVKKTQILASSKHSRLQFSPADVSFDILKEDPDPAKFDKGMQTVGVLLEGNFPSNFENRVSQDMVNGLKQLGLEYLPQSVNTRMVVISDGDVAANFVRDPIKKSWDPLGYNRFEKVTYANKELMLNAVEYLIDPTGVIEARTKEVKLRQLDTIRAQAEQTQWRLFNIGVPLLLLGLFGFIFMWLRKRKYSA